MSMEKKTIQPKWSLGWLVLCYEVKPYSMWFKHRRHTYHICLWHRLDRLEWWLATRKTEGKEISLFYSRSQNNHCWLFFRYLHILIASVCPLITALAFYVHLGEGPGKFFLIVSLFPFILPPNIFLYISENSLWWHCNLSWIFFFFFGHAAWPVDLSSPTRNCLFIPSPLSSHCIYAPFLIVPSSNIVDIISVCSCCLVAKLCPTLLWPPWTATHWTSLTLGFPRQWMLEWVAISFSMRSSWPRDQNCVSWISCIGRQILYHWATRETHYIG